MSTLKILSSGDWEISRERLPALTEAADYIVDLMVDGGYDIFVYTGDLFRHFGPHETEWARRYFCDKLVSPKTGLPPKILTGNHDWRPDINELEAVFTDGPSWTKPQIITRPTVVTVEGHELAFLPAPNRDTLGAALEAQGPRERDAEISRVLEAAMIDLERFVKGPLSEAALFFHATVNTTRFNGSKLSDGLTWTVDGARLSRWGAAIGGHIHNPVDLGSEYDQPGHLSQIHYTGTIIHDTHGQKAQRFRAIQLSMIKGEQPAVVSVEIPTVVVPIEAVWTADGFQGPDDTELYTNSGLPLIPSLIGFLADRCKVRLDEGLVDLKLRARMPRADLDLLPSEAELTASLHQAVGRDWLANLKIKREEVATHKEVLAEAHDAGAMDLEQLFELWLESSKLTDHPNAEAARILVSQRSSEWKVETNVGVKMIRTRVVNFRQWADVEIDWEALEGTVAVIGDNEAGKTNLIEAPLFAWYKKTPRTEGRLEGLRYELNRDADKGLVEHVWQAGGKRYMVRRAMERHQARTDGLGDVSCKTELFRCRPAEDGIVGSYDLEALASGIDADKKIVEIVGGYDFLVSTFYGTSTQINKLIDATPARWHEIFIEALSLGRFEEFRKEAAKDQRDALEDSKKADTLLEEIDGQITVKAEELGDLPTGDHLTAQLALNKRTFGASEHTIEAHRKERDRLVDVRAGFEARASQEARLVASVGSAQKALDKIIAEEAEDPGEEPTAAANQALEVQLREEAEILRGIDAQLEELKGNRKAWAAKKVDNEKLIQARFVRLEALDIEIGKILGGVEAPPCDGLSWNNGDLEPPIMEGCPAWAVYARPETLKKLKDEQDERRRELEDFEEAVVALGQTLEGSEPKLKELEGWYASRKQKVDEIKAEKDKVDETYKAVEIWALKHKARLAWVDRRVEAEQRLKDLTEQRAEVKGVSAQVGELTQQILELEAKIRAQVLESAKILEDRTKLEKAEAALVALESDLEKLRARRQELHQAAAQASTKAEVLGLVAQSFHNSGIPFLLIDRMVPAFQAEANRILATTHLSIEARQSRPVGTGGDQKVVDELRIYFTDDRGTWPLKLASGEQRVAVGLPLRAALAKVGAEFWGQIPEIFVQDEGFGAFHGSKHAMGIELIRKISASFQSFVYITHVVPMAEAADRILEVHADPVAGSRVVLT